MPDSLLQTLRDSVPPELAGTLARDLRAPDGAIAGALDSSLATILAAIAGRAGRAEDLSPVYHLITASETDEPAASESRAVLAPPSEIAHGLGAMLLTELFGERAAAVAGLVGDAAGLPTPAATTVLGFAAPLAAGGLGRWVREHDADAAALGRAALAEQEAIVQAAPEGTASVVDLADPAEIGRVSLPYLITDAPRPRRERRWLWPALAVLLVAGVIWAVVRSQTPDLPVEAVVSLDGNAGAADAPPAPADLGPEVLRELPGGREIEIPTRGVEQRLIAFIEHAGPVGDSAWFALDRLVFESGSAVPTIDSRDQIRDIAAVLAAYPRVRLRIAGAADGSGDAGADRRLARMRADTLQAWLVELGIAAERVGTSEALLPADSSAPRLALRITRK